MRVKIVVILLLVGLSTARAETEIEFHLLWQVAGNVTDMHVADVNEDGYQEILLGTGYSYEKMLTTPTGQVTAMICEGMMSQFEPNGTLVWEKKVCKNATASDPCYSNGCISALHADSICTTTRKLIFTACCYCGKYSLIRVYTAEGELIQEFGQGIAAGVPIPFDGCVRQILVEDVDADNCKDIIVATNMKLFLFITDCQTCSIPFTPTFSVTSTGMINEVIVVNFDDDNTPTKEIVVAADDLTVYESNLAVKWAYEIDPSWPVRTVYAFDVDSDTAAHEIDQDPDLEPELIVGESWYMYVLDNMDQGNTNPADDLPNLKWEYSTSPYEVNTVYAGPFVGPRNIMGGATSMVYVLDYNGNLLRTYNAPGEVRRMDLADFDRDGQNELTVFSNKYVSVFSTAEMVWSSQNLQGDYINGVVVDTNLDGYPEIVAGITLGLYIIGVEELESKDESDADHLYDTAKGLMDAGHLVEAMVYFEQARTKYEEAGNTFMAIQCQKKVSECEKVLDTDRVVAAAMENLRNCQYEQASYLFGEAADLYAKVGDKSKMSQMRILKEATENLWQAHATLMEAHHLLWEGDYSEAKVEATWAGNLFEDVSGLFLTMSLDSIYETLKLEISGRMRECEEVQQLCDQFIQMEEFKEEAERNASEGERFFRNQQYSQAKYSYKQAEEAYTEAARLLDELQIALGRRADNFRRDVSSIDGKIKTLQQSDIYETYEDVYTSQTISDLEEKKEVYEDLIDEYEDLAESVERMARDCRTKAVQTENKSNQSVSLGDQFLEYGREVLQPPTSLAIGLACLIVALIGLAAGKGKYVALVFLILVLIFLGVAALRFY